MGRTEGYTHPRALALRLIQTVLDKKLFLEDAFSQFQIPQESRSWLLEVCSGVLRWKRRLETLIDAQTPRKTKGITRGILTLSAYQILVQTESVPQKVINEAVEFAKRQIGPQVGGFVNAVLRKLMKYRPDQGASFFTEKNASWASVPDWFWEKLREEHGDHWAEEFCQASLDRPRVWLRSRDGAPSAELGLKPGPLPGSYEYQSGDLEAALSESESLQAQDLASQFLVGEVSRQFSQRGVQKVLDLCAAPGGKSIGLSWNGFDVYSTDQSVSRFARLKANVDKLSSKRHLVDYTDRYEDGPYDAIWIDAPCSASGLIRRHPEIRWNRGPHDLSSLTEVQNSLIQDALPHIRSGGLLVYSVCSVFKEEGENILTPFLQQTAPIASWLLAPQDELSSDGFWCKVVELR